MITEIRNGFNVKRFHTTHRIVGETNGHHSANVCAILLRLDPDCSKALLVEALMHDVPEAYTGDVPAPFKWENEEAKLALTNGELMYKVKNALPSEDYLTEDERHLLKAADMMDLVLSSLEEAGRGNQFAWQLVENGRAYLMDMELPIETLEKCQQMVNEVKASWQLTTDK